MCNVFVRHFDQLILDYSTPHWFVYVYSVKNLTHTGARERMRERGREGCCFAGTMVTRL